MNVSPPKQRSQPLNLTFELATKGKTPLAIAEKDFSICIMKGTWSFTGDISLTNKTTKIVTAYPDEPATVTALVFLTEGEGEKKRQIELAPGRYRLQVSVGSGKVQEFDYQYMGVNYSKQFEFEVK